jgi:hypothetical protein
MNKVHRIASEGKHGQPSRTMCGRKGWLARHTSTEYETVSGDRFEAVATQSGVTCRKCLTTKEQSPAKGER